MSTPCPCGSGAPLAGCCGPRHDGTRPAPTAEALMRARYAAFALARVDYLVATHATPDDREALERACRGVTWLGLDVESTERGGEQDDDGAVTFTARSLEHDVELALHERSRFERRDGRWVYVDGEPRVSRRRVARNEPCPCGSGRKFKQCHA